MLSAANGNASAAIMQSRPARTAAPSVKSHCGKPSCKAV